MLLLFSDVSCEQPKNIFVIEVERPKDVGRVISGNSRLLDGLPVRWVLFQIKIWNFSYFRQWSSGMWCHAVQHLITNILGKLVAVGHIQYTVILMFTAVRTSDSFWFCVFLFVPIVSQHVLILEKERPATVWRSTDTRRSIVFNKTEALADIHIYHLYIIREALKILNCPQNFH